MGCSFHFSCFFFFSSRRRHTRYIGDWSSDVCSSDLINMLDHPEFWDIDTTRELLRTFEHKERLAELMTTLAADDGVRVMIGDENPVSEMRECTLITSTYMYRDQVLGILGVVGPRRLPYPEVISVVNETARQVTEVLSRVRQDLYLPS